jgi:nucleoside-diphosphate-sugar epimerase
MQLLFTYKTNKMEKTISVTGGTGYIGSWVVKELLEKGYRVRVNVRSMEKVEKYAHIKILPNADSHLEIFEADLLVDGSFDKAADGADAIIHLASPFTLRFKDPLKDLVEPAVKGTRNVLNAANKSATVKRVVLTSSVAAVHGDNIDMKELGVKEFTEEHFNTTSSLKHQPYSFSKVQAEKEAWKIHSEQDKWSLVVINPSFVMGPSLTGRSNSESLQLMKDLLSGKYRFGAPELYFGFVDVRDVAKAHVLALENENLTGRFILAERVASFMDLVAVVNRNFPKQYKLPKMVAPKPLLLLVSRMFGLTPKFVKRNVGHPIAFNTNRSKQELGLAYTPFEQTVVDMVKQYREN